MATTVTWREEKDESEPPREKREKREGGEEVELLLPSFLPHRALLSTLTVILQHHKALQRE